MSQTNNEIHAIKDLQDFENYINGQQVEFEEPSSKAAIFLTKNVELDKDYLIFDSSVPQYQKCPKLAASRFLQDMQLLEALGNKYVPIIDRQTKKLLFTEQAFLSLRKKISGLARYNADNFIFSDNLYFYGIENYLKIIDQNFAQIADEQTHILATLQNIGEIKDNQFKIINIGSTARGTNIPTFSGPSTFDFDFIIQVDESQIATLLNSIANSLSYSSGESINGRRLRLKNVYIAGLDKTIDLDISFVPKKEAYLSTDQALKDRLEQIKLQNPEKYKLVLANIMHAKKTLKEAHVYKASRSDKTQCGLGGVGIENWVLQNGGSFKDAAVSFLEASENQNFIDFEKKYPIFDFGKNHMSVAKGTFPYDNFVMKNMRENGYIAMQKVLTEFLYKELEKPINITAKLWIFSEFFCLKKNISF